MYKTLLLACLSGVVAGASILSAYASDADTGKTIYFRTCLVCHGSDGTGDMPGVSDLTKKGAGLYQDDSILLSRMQNGYQSTDSSMAMPPRGGDPALTESDLKEVLKFMRKKFQVP
ncbi:MAG: hypothetical protein B7Y56_10760 [Gallionellales bacterium 35-53-114]|jgi:cytochrome c5|nr:MAG: hypothetical protein B7Y56_10760 [Gallionellales bacterium 35-53-114]OYZ64895.1 MAG: hypothetical protein B7Y04_03840 [Gallionellales bacterium 24-53-125]OZB07567.1 MAG: hypothetical protein B7X61_13175 [Gallionellales bacterium 39-52-133]HQS58754.1 c-type cytochrome [Gallionellaceae bacterium]HQS75094.1 c-type cytochrome [Gallionellaceae bacterium]